MKRNLVTALTVSLILQAVIPGYANPISVPAGTPVIVKLLEAVSSATHKQGDKITLTVVTDVIVEGKKVIAAGAPVNGTVKSAAKRFIAGIGGQIEITVNDVKAVDGTTIPLKFSKETHNGSTLVAALVAVICCCCAWLIPGKDVQIDKDTLFDTMTAGPITINS